MSDGLSSEVLAVGVDIGEDRLGAAHYHTARRSNEGSAWQDHFVAWAAPESVECEFQSDRPIGHGNTVSAARLRGKLFLESPALFAGPVIDLSGFQNARCSSNFVRVKVWPRWKRSRPNWLGTFHCELLIGSSGIHCHAFL